LVVTVIPQCPANRVNRTAGIVDSYPAPTVVGLLGEHLDRSRLVVSFPVQTALSVLLSRPPVDVTKRRQMISDSQAD
jgi:hypothetical protein